MRDNIAKYGEDSLAIFFCTKKGKPSPKIKLAVSLELI